MGSMCRRCFLGLHVARCHGFGTIARSECRLRKSIIGLHSHFIPAGFEGMGGTDVMSLVLS